MKSPFLVLIRLAWVIIPPIVTQSASRRVGQPASVLSDLARSAAPTSLSGCAEMNRPIDSFSAASNSGLVELVAGIGAWLGPRSAPAAPLPAASRRRRPAEIEDRALADQRVLLGLLTRALGLLEHLSMPLRVAPVDPNAPHLISASIAFLLTARLSIRSQKSNRLDERAGGRVVVPASLLDRLDGRVADALDRVEPEADVAVDDHELVV